MKKMLWILPVLVLFTQQGLFAGSIDYLTNQSAKWLISPSRNAATEGADIANYNPAGTAFLPKGLHLDLSNQTLFKLYENGDMQFSPTDTGRALNLLPSDYGTFEPEMLTPALPNLYAVYNFGQIGSGSLAFYLQGGVTAGGGDLDWQDGTAGMTYALSGLRIGVLGASVQAGTPTDFGKIASQSFKASSIYYGVGLGGAYSFLEDSLSLSLGGRLVIPQRSFAFAASFENLGGSLDAEYEYNALGFTPIIGFDLRPTQGLTLAVRYEVETKLEFEYDEKKLNVSPSLAAAMQQYKVDPLTSSGIYDGATFNLNLPHIIAVGAECQVNDALAVSLSVNLYLLSIADYGEKTSEYFGTGYEFGLGATYKLIENLKLGMGLIYTESGVLDPYFNDSILNASANPPLDSVAVGLGGTYAFKNGLDITLSGLYSHYLPRDFETIIGNNEMEFARITGTYKKDVIEVGIGIGFHY
ncbi:MAG: outer membrane protein transport protein [Treponema sp.]|jgi:long-chain fatty acid transport protein|nr:outer membrane protein transport protein [Treponema sp.]